MCGNWHVVCTCWWYLYGERSSSSLVYSAQRAQSVILSTGVWSWDSPLKIESLMPFHPSPHPSTLRCRLWRIHPGYQALLDHYKRVYTSYIYVRDFVKYRECKKGALLKHSPAATTTGRFSFPRISYVLENHPSLIVWYVQSVEPFDPLGFWSWGETEDEKWINEWV